jgi:hypothetical protein
VEDEVNSGPCLCSGNRLFPSRGGTAGAQAAGAAESEAPGADRSGLDTEGVTFLVFMTLPGLVIVLTALAFVDQLVLRAGRAGVLPWRNGARQGQISATGFEQLHASLSPGKQNELKERQSALVMPDNEDDGAPPNRTTVDLDGGIAVVRMLPAAQ